jgi:hypothetical protein
MTALQAGAPWDLPRSRRWVWRVSPAHLGRAERKRGLSRVARCTALIAALTWAVTLAPVVEAQQAHTTAASAATPPAAFTVANSEADPLAVLGVGLRKVLDDLRAGRPISARGGLPQRAAAVEALPAFLSYPVLEAMALALPALALPALALSEHVLTPHPGALSNAFVISPADAAAPVPVSRFVVRVPAPTAALGPGPVNHFPTPTPPPTEPGAITSPGGNDGRVHPPADPPVVVVPGDDDVDPMPDTSLPPANAAPAAPPPREPSPAPPVPPITEPEPDPVIEAGPAAATPGDTAPPAPPPRADVITWLEHQLGVPHAIPTDPSDQQLALWISLLERCAPGGAALVAACVDANQELLGGRA